MADALRCFVAVNLPETIREEVGSFFSALDRKIRGVKWVRQDNLHVTLKFLGNVERPAVAEIASAMEKTLSGHRPFTVTLCGAGVFPPRGRPRIVWVDIAEGGEEMVCVQREVEDALGPLGFPSEGRPFTPHLTVGRARALRDPGLLTRALASISDRKWGEFVADRVQLMRSELFPTGPRYSILHTVHLG